MLDLDAGSGWRVCVVSLLAIARWKRIFPWSDLASRVSATGCSNLANPAFPRNSANASARTSAADLGISIADPPGTLAASAAFPAPPQAPLHPHAPPFWQACPLGTWRAHGSSSRQGSSRTLIWYWVSMWSVSTLRIAAPRGGQPHGAVGPELNCGPASRLAQAEFWTWSSSSRRSAR